VITPFIAVFEAMRGGLVAEMGMVSDCEEIPVKTPFVQFVMLQSV
jgi:hypothetical protein